MSVVPSTNPAPLTRSPAADRSRVQTGPRQSQAARRSAIEPGQTAVLAPVQPGAGEAAGRHLDLLAIERSNKRISEAEYLVGRMIQEAFERHSGARFGTPAWNDARSTDHGAVHELAMILRLKDADRIYRLSVRLEKVVGQAGVQFLRAILVEGQNFGEYARARGRSGKDAATCIADRFRWMLNALATTHHTATGPDRTPIRGGPC